MMSMNKQNRIIKFGNKNDFRFYCFDKKSYCLDIFEIAVWGNVLIKHLSSSVDTGFKKSLSLYKVQAL